MAFVVDASVALAWCYPEEGTAYTRSILREARRNQAVAPAVWQLEICNGLLVGERRRRLSLKQSQTLLQLFSELPVTIDTESASRGFTLAQLARKHRLSSYDASYLELATRLRIPLATNDKRLRAAARSEGVDLAQPA